MMKASVFERPLFWLPECGLRVLISFRDNCLEIYDIAVGIESRSCGEVLAVPLGYCLGNERPAKESDREIRTAATASADDGRRDSGEAGASISLKCVAIIIASGD